MHLRQWPGTNSYNINWNYGMFPKTWEDPAHKNPEVKDMAGDNDPVDIVEIGSKAHPMGSVITVRARTIISLTRPYAACCFLLVRIDVNMFARSR